MTYEEFKAKLIDRLSDDIPDPKEITIRPVERNNGNTIDALVILENGSNIGPTIYLDRYWKEVLSENDFARVYRRILDFHKENSESGKRLDVSFFTDFEKVSKHIFIKLINAEMNAALLSRIPFRKFMDLAIVYVVQYPTEDEGTASILIDNSHLRLWNIDISQLHDIAMDNSQRIFAPRFRGINDVLKALCEEVEADDDSDAEEAVLPMYVLTNRQNQFGAACIAYDGQLESIAARVGGSYYVLPSSIHEVIVVPVDFIHPEGLNDMVRTVNATQVKDEEVLADHAYLYNAETKRLMPCA